MTDAEINAAFTEKVQRGMFTPVARHLTNPDTVEDRMQEALALVWEMYRDRIVNRVLVLDDAILVHAAKQRACDLSRHLVRDGKCSVHDAMSERAYHAGHVEVLRLDAWTEDDEEDEGHPHQIGLAEELCQSPERKMNSALDLEAWLDGLTARDRSLMEGRMAGYELRRLGHDLGYSVPTTCRKVKQLGLELAARAGIWIELDRKRSGSHLECVSTTE